MTRIGFSLDRLKKLQVGASQHGCAGFHTYNLLKAPQAVSRGQPFLMLFKTGNTCQNLSFPRCTSWINNFLVFDDISRNTETEAKRKTANNATRLSRAPTPALKWSRAVAMPLRLSLGLLNYLPAIIVDRHRVSSEETAALVLENAVFTLVMMKPEGRLRQEALFDFQIILLTPDT